MTINIKTYRAILAEVHNYNEANAFASDLSLSSIWHDAPDANIPMDRFAALVELYTMSTMTVRELIDFAGMSQTMLSDRFGIPLRTVQGWCAPASSPSHRDCPLHIRLMMAECLGLIHFDII